jgi:hypothetical protein
MLGLLGVIENFDYLGKVQFFKNIGCVVFFNPLMIER